MTEYLVALALTLLIECACAFMLGFRGKADLASVVLANLVTHPALWYILLVNATFSLLPYGWPLILALEALVVLAEWKLLVAGTGRASTPMFCLSLTMNAASFLFGIIVLGTGF